MLGLRPVGQQSCIAQEILVPAGYALSGLRWYHNDGTLAFPKLLLMEAGADETPGLQNTALVLTGVSGGSLAWTEVTLGLPVTSTTGRIFAVFVLPADRERTGEGTSGGPGLGFVAARQASRAFVSGEGSTWLPLHEDYRLAVEPIFSPLKGGPTTLASLLAGQGQLMATDEAPGGEQATQVLHTRLLRPAPNPFNPQTEIRFELARKSRVRIEVFDVRGRLVRTVFQGVRSPGVHRVVWNGRDRRQAPVASGVYLVRMQVGSQTFVERLALVR